MYKLQKAEIFFLKNFNNQKKFFFNKNNLK